MCLVRRTALNYINLQLFSDLDSVAGSSQSGSDLRPEKDDTTTRKYSKPRRPCRYCGKFQTQLSRHLRLRHAGEDGVKKALSKTGKARSHKFDILRKDGIYNYNMVALKNDKPLITERRMAIQRDLKLCEKCRAFLSRRYFHRHAKLCQARFDAGAVRGLDLQVVDESCSLEFTDLLSRFSADDIGKLCKTDRTLKLIGRALFEKNRRKIAKMSGARKAVSTKMRTLANLYNAFYPHVKKDIRPTVEDMFSRTYFSELEQAIHDVTLCADGSLKCGLKITIGNLLKSGARILKGHYLISDDDLSASSMDKFLEVLRWRWTTLFGDAEYQIMLNRQVKLRRPESLPDEENIARLRDYTVTKLKALLEGGYEVACADTFISVRDLVVARLTLYNARRGGEPSRLMIKDWQDGREGNWVDKQRSRLLQTEEEEVLMNSFKIMYQSGKGNNRLVPVLVPPDLVEGLNYLEDSTIRKESGVHDLNKFLFPSTRSSLDHASGWHCVKKVVTAARLSTNITATQMRHRASTLYAQMDVPEIDRQAFYGHMGHSSEINKNVYQCPLAIQEVTRVGKYLASIDGMQAEKVTVTSREPRTEKTVPDATSMASRRPSSTAQETSGDAEICTAQSARKRPLPAIQKSAQDPPTNKYGETETVSGTCLLSD